MMQPKTFINVCICTIGILETSIQSQDNTISLAWPATVSISSSFQEVTTYFLILTSGKLKSVPLSPSTFVVLTLGIKYGP
jgi:hypothetical protein